MASIAVSLSAGGGGGGASARGGVGRRVTASPLNASVNSTLNLRTAALEQATKANLASCPRIPRQIRTEIKLLGNIIQEKDILIHR